MTTREAILARLGRSPATAPELYDAMVSLAKIDPDKAYPLVFNTIQELTASGDVEHLADFNLYRLTEKQIPRTTKEDEE